MRERSDTLTEFAQQLVLLMLKMCLCNNRYFLLDCPLYTIEHNQMLSKLIQLEFEPLLNNHNLLFIKEMYSEEIGKKAFLVIQQFIDDSKYFGN